MLTQVAVSESDCGNNGTSNRPTGAEMSIPVTSICKHSHRIAALILAALAALTLDAPLSAQVTGSVAGWVLDRSGSVVAGAAVALVSGSTGVERKSNTDGQGAFL